MSNAYFQHFGISQSAIKDWRFMSPKKWYDTWIAKTRKRPETRGTVLGSLMDCLALTPDDLDKRFIKAEGKVPSEKVEKILKKLIENINQLNKNAAELNFVEKNKKKHIPMKELTLDKDMIMALCVQEDHYASKPEQGYNDVIKKGTEYFEFLQKSGKKTVYTDADYADAMKMKEALHTDPVSRPFFVPGKNCEVIHQVQIKIDHEVGPYENVEVVPLKGMMDTLHFNHKKEWVREIDTKYTHEVAMFKKAIKDFGYVDQHSFYDNLIRKWLLTYEDGKYAHYQVQNPLNVVIDNEEYTPHLFMYNFTDLEIARTGVPNTKITGWEDIIDEIAWHINCGDWSRPRTHVKNGYIPVEGWYKK